MLLTGHSHINLFSPFFLASSGIFASGLSCFWSEEKAMWAQFLMSSVVVGDGLCSEGAGKLPVADIQKKLLVMLQKLKNTIN